MISYSILSFWLSLHYVRFFIKCSVSFNIISYIASLKLIYYTLYLVLYSILGFTFALLIVSYWTIDYVIFSYTPCSLYCMILDTRIFFRYTFSSLIFACDDKFFLIYGMWSLINHTCFQYTQCMVFEWKNLDNWN